MKLFHVYTLSLGLAAATVFALSGCGQQANQDEASTAETAHDEHAGHDHDGEPMHGGWWCYEHGIPEEQCAMCDAELAKELREKGDWCEEHNRPDSLCFKCHPEKVEEFAKLYEAKYGKKAPKPLD